jgi:hypothetical protein
MFKKEVTIVVAFKNLFVHLPVDLCHVPRIRRICHDQIDSKPQKYHGLAYFYNSVGFDPYGVRRHPNGSSLGPLI